MVSEPVTDGVTGVVHEIHDMRLFRLQMPEKYSPTFGSSIHPNVTRAIFPLMNDRAFRGAGGVAFTRGR